MVLEATRTPSLEPLVLPPEAISARAARRWAVAQVRALGHEDLVDVVELLVSEVVSNAIIHAGTALRITLGPSPQGGVRVDVWDGSPARPRRRFGYSRTATTGRGTQFLEELATSWGSDRAEGGKVTWFRVEPSESCPDRTSDDVVKEWTDD